MLDRILAVIMSVIAFIAGLFGLESKVTTYEYRDVSYGTHERHTLDLTPSVGKEVFVSRTKFPVFLPKAS